jgi:hypothetical protein
MKERSCCNNETRPRSRTWRRRQAIQVSVEPISIVVLPYEDTDDTFRVGVKVAPIDSTVDLRSLI